MTADVQVNEEVVRKVMAGTQVDKTSMRSSYAEVRDDASQTNWVVFKYEGNEVVLAGKGENFGDFKAQFDEGERAFGYIRLQTGDELSKRVKFMLITWVGQGVSAIKRAKMSTDKALIKEVIANFAVEVTVESEIELDEMAFRELLQKSGGANYGTGVREL